MAHVHIECRALRMKYRRSTLICASAEGHWPVVSTRRGKKVPWQTGHWRSHAMGDRSSDRPPKKHEQRPACRAAVRHLDEPANGEDVTDGRGPLALAGGTHRVLADRGWDRSGQDHGRGPRARILAHSMCNWPARRRTRPSPGQSTHSSWRGVLGDEPRPLLGRECQSGPQVSAGSKTRRISASRSLASMAW